MSLNQAAILAPVPQAGQYLFFSLESNSTDRLRSCLSALAELVDGNQLLVGLGSDLLDALHTQVPGLRAFQAYAAHGIELPATPMALCCWLCGSDRGELWHLARRLERALSPALRLLQSLDAFRHGQGPNGHGRDLSGYEDGTENPEAELAQQAALVNGAGPGLDGGSFMLVQQWLHDLPAFESMTASEQDHVIGRRRSDNEELEEAPDSAHVKRTAQEDFEPEAFMVRRSMPWTRDKECGLVFVAFARSLDVFEAQLQRMLGMQDGVTDALFSFSKPLSGAYYWCPPLREGRLDLRQIGL